MQITVALVQQLIAAQFPHWAGLPVRPVATSGWDNHTFHLGAAMLVRLPSAEGYAPQVAKEQHWLPQLAPHLPLPIPAPLAQGTPSAAFPYPWSVYRWLPGTHATYEGIDDLAIFARDLAHFLRALQAIDPTGGPPAGAHSYYRGGSLTVYDADTRRALAALAAPDPLAAQEGAEALPGGIDLPAAGAVWEEALAAPYLGPGVWVHGDVAPGNLLVVHGCLSAVIDFGCCAVGDPACDLVIAWTFLDAGSRAVFRRTLDLDDATWARARGWALWKALIVAAGIAATNAVEAVHARRTLAQLLSR